MVEAMGEADIIKYVQTLPGVSTGAEGSSAIYVRGGNIGSNLTTLDGVLYMEEATFWGCQVRIRLTLSRTPASVSEDFTGTRAI